MIIIFLFIFSLLKCQHFIAKTVSQDPIPESNVEVTDITSSPADDNAAPETCDKIMNTDESYLSNLSVRN